MHSCSDVAAWFKHNLVLLQIPAVDGLQVVDVTGCGNAFCGGLLSAWQSGQGLQESGMWGCVAGSIMAEWQGVPEETPAKLQHLAQQRFDSLRPKVIQLSAAAKQARRTTSVQTAVSARMKVTCTASLKQLQRQHLSRLTSAHVRHSRVQRSCFHTTPKPSFARAI